MESSNPIVVVGGSLAGLRAVESLRRRGVDRSVVWVSAEDTLPYDRPPLSKQVLRGEWEPSRTALKANYALLGVEPLLGVRATSLDAENRQVHLSNGDVVPYSGVVIATGATARNLPGAEGLRGVHTLRTLADAVAIRRALEQRPRVAVVGAGFIGLEVASSCRALGLEVTVVEALPTPLERQLGATMGQAVADVHAAEGVKLRAGVSVQRVLETADRVEALVLSDGSTLAADLVVVGIGVEPETRWLTGSGVRLERGVLCDSRCRTSVPDVVACGDVARWIDAAGNATLVEHWTNAVEQANAAVAALLDGDGAPEYRTVPYFWSDQYDAKLQFAGQVAPGDTLRVVSGSVATRDLVAIYGRAGRLTAVLTVNNPAAFIRTRRALQQGAPFDVE
ncbi:MAG TPA: FAD-dependent oxidoreductase [Polyangiaceae bacterium]|nr:FAD-dependent oxidoreductase [Polyangiaceae bacterium]